MKVNIGPYLSDYRFERLKNTYLKIRYSDKYINFYIDDKDPAGIDWCVIEFCGLLSKTIGKVFRSFQRDRKVKIHIDDYDVWNADNTLALIIHPILLKLKEVKHGSPNVDIKDVPKNLRPTELANKNNYYTDNTINERWDWVLSEMIWAFEQCTKNDKNDYQFHHNSEQLEMIFIPIENSTNSTLSFNHQKDPNKPKYWIDEKGKTAHHKRIQNGLRLFSKYYFSLWD